MNLKEWKYISAFGFTSAIYGKDNERVMVDKGNSKLIIRYKMSDKEKRDRGV